MNALWQPWSTRYWNLLLIICGIFLSGCATSIYSNSHHHNSGLSLGQLQIDGLAFLTPSTVTGQEEDKQALALIFSDVLKELYPKVRYSSLPETLSAINNQGLTDEYRTMYEQYRYTGIFRRDTLQKIGKAAGVRYVAQLKLAGFEQGTEGRFGLLGWRLVDTKFAKVRLFMQIWDSANGTIVWEVTHEMNYAFDTMQESSVTFRNVVESSARDVLRRLPMSDEQPESVAENIALPRSTSN